MTECVVQIHVLGLQCLQLSESAVWNPSGADSAFLILKLIYLNLIHLRD